MIEALVRIEKKDEEYTLVIEAQEIRIEHPFLYIPKGRFIRCNTSKVDMNAFYYAPFAVTQELYEAVMGYNPSKNRGSLNPVDTVSWYNSVDFCDKLNKILQFPLPFYQIDKAKEDKRNKDESDRTKWTVDFNTRGNGFRLPTEVEWEYIAYCGKLEFPRLFEWCWDWMGDYKNPTGAKKGSARVLRTGTLDYGRDWRYCWSPERLFKNYGFRMIFVP